MKQVIRLIVYLIDNEITKSVFFYTGDKPSQCIMYGNEIANPVALYKRMVIHTGEKPSQCTLCDNEFANLVALYKYMVMHTGEKPSQCIICDNEIAKPVDFYKYGDAYWRKTFPMYSM